MLSLAALPQEVLLSIASWVGGAHLRAHPAKLLLCHAWHRVAYPLALEDLLLTGTTLPRFLAAPPYTHRLLETNARTLSITATDLDFATEEERQVLLEPPHSLDEQVAMMAVLRNSPARNAQVFQLYERLRALAPHVARMRRLRALRVDVFLHFDAPPLQEERWRIAAAALLSAAVALSSSLTSLTLDTCGRVAVPEPEGSWVHLCPLLLSVPALRHLRVRMSSVCAGVFRGEGSGGGPRLESLVVNLSLERRGVWSGLGVSSRCCAGVELQDGGVYDHIVEGANAAAGHLPRLKTLRILRHKLPSLGLISYDVLSGRKVLVPEEVGWEDVEWDDDGASDPDDKERSDDGDEGWDADSAASESAS